MAVNQKANADSLWASLQSIGRGAKAAIEAPSNLFRSALDGATNLVTTGSSGNSFMSKPIIDTSAGKYATKPLYESIVPSRPTETQTQPLDMRGFQSTVTGAGNLSNGLWNNGVGVQNPLSVGYTPTQVDSVAKTVVGSGNATQSPSTPAPTLYASNQASNASGVPTVQNATFQSPTNEMTNPMDMSMPVEMPSGYNVSNPTSGLAANAAGGASTPYSFMDNFTDFSSMDATKNSLGNIATGVNVAGGLFDAYTKYQTQKAQADYQNRIASLYEKQYNDTEARRANAQANYDASVPK